MQTDRPAYNKNKKLIQKTVENLQPGDYLRLRKLTPRESLRLMGIDDKHIDKMLYESGNSEDQIYKQSGNSIVVDVLFHLFRRMFIDRTNLDLGQSRPLI